MHQEFADAESLRPMPRHVLGRTGQEISLLGFGAEALGRAGRSFEDAQRTLYGVLDAGVTLIDTAAAYGSSEKFIGGALADRHRRGEFTLVTKCGWVNPDYRPAWSRAEIEQSIDQSLRDLQIERIDVLLLHSCDLETLRRGEVVETVQRARDAGKARFIGYSGDNEVLLSAIETQAFDVIECSFNVLDQANRPNIALANSRGLGVLIKRPIANAVPGATSRPRSEYAAQYWPRWQAIELRDDLVQDISGGFLEASLRFSAFHLGIDCVLIGSSSADHMRANAKWLANGPLPSACVHVIEDAYRRVGRSWPALG